MSNLKITQCKREGQVNRMSDDLISKKAVIALIDKLGYINVSSRDNFNANCRMDKVRQEVVKLPTAFDTEKVIAELVNLRQKEYTMTIVKKNFLTEKRYMTKGVPKVGLRRITKPLRLLTKAGLNNE